MPHAHQYFTNKINDSAAGDPRDKPEDDGFDVGALPQKPYAITLFRPLIVISYGWREPPMTISDDDPRDRYHPPLP